MQKEMNSLGSFRSKSGEERLRKRRLQRWMLLLGALGLLSLSALLLTSTNIRAPVYMNPCDLFGGKVCIDSLFQPPTPPPRALTDEELAMRVLAKDLLLDRTTPSNQKPKIAFMFLTAGPLPFEALWEKFFEGHLGLYSIYVHASRRAELKSVWNSSIFIDHEIPSQQVFWGRIEMVDAERRLLANALTDQDNQYFALISESCVPLYNFTFIYNYLLGANMSFVDCFDDPGPHGQGRYLSQMAPEVPRTEWRKGAQWFAVNRKHALLIVADHLYHHKFKEFCKPGPENRNCYPDEHYLQTFMHMMDPGHLSNWTVTHVDWSEGKWHPKAYEKVDVTKEILLKIKSIQEHVHVTSDGRQLKTVVPCIWNGHQRPCFLFARKFTPETANALLELLPNKVWATLNPVL